jgi:hypothetical protein
LKVHVHLYIHRICMFFITCMPVTSDKMFSIHFKKLEETMGGWRGVYFLFACVCVCVLRLTVFACRSQLLRIDEGITTITT